MEMREVVGPTDLGAFDNPNGTPIFADLPDDAYTSILDFGCGCGRLARQLIQQDPRPRRYLGIDLHPQMIEWCQSSLAPHAPSFEFRHHDVRYPGWNPGEDKPEVAAFPLEDDSCTLVIAYSVFTHLVQKQAEYYLQEAARVLASGGVFEATWFLFDKRVFPMMQDFQDALYINDLDPANAVIFDRSWLVETGRQNGLGVSEAVPPHVHGYHWRIRMTPSQEGLAADDFPEDDGPSPRRGFALRSFPAAE